MMQRLSEDFKLWTKQYPNPSIAQKQIQGKGQKASICVQESMPSGLFFLV